MTALTNLRENMNMRKIVIWVMPVAALAAAMLAPPAAAQQQLNIFSFDDTSCAAWSKSAGNRAIRAQYEFWIRGFASGHNYANQGRQVPVGKLPGSDRLYAYLDEYCHDNPNSSFVGGAFRLVEQFREATPPAKPAAAPVKKEAPKAPPAPAK
jgi:hypothetical protein